MARDRSEKRLGCYFHLNGRPSSADVLCARQTQYLRTTQPFFWRWYRMLDEWKCLMVPCDRTVCMHLKLGTTQYIIQTYCFFLSLTTPPSVHCSSYFNCCIFRIFEGKWSSKTVRLACKLLVLELRNESFVSKLWERIRDGNKQTGDCRKVTFIWSSK